ncbi:MAG: IS66 family transposase [Solirubrobacterales bacterium]|nr:MAG: IS66 family transposase [Solirubrobacterales bacterium]
MERSEAEAIYDSGREACVEFLIGLATGQQRLEERLRAVEQKAAASSRNSSQPPSTDALKTRQQRRAEAREKAKELLKKDGKKRTAGGQPGHPGAGRKLLGEDRMQEIVNHYPGECSGCGREFTEEEKVPRHRPGRHQVAELPPTAVVYTEHRTHRLRCPGCAKRTRATLGIVGESAFGPGLQAAIVALTARNRVSRRDMSELLFEHFGVQISVGALDRVCQRTSVLLAGPHERLVSQVLGCGAINVDETGWYLAAENRWMWTAASADGAVFRIAEDRHSDRLTELLGTDFHGIVTSDRWWAYGLLDPEQRQACWSHLVRDFRFHSEGLAEQKTFGEAGLALTVRLFTAWHAFAEHHDRDRLTAEMTPIQNELRELLAHAGEKSKRHRLHRGFANNLIKIWPALWTFITVPGVTPTNNAAERALRGPVIHRKLSHGNQSGDGERFTERSLSASVTCRLQHRSLLTYLRELLTAHQTGGALPALL